MIDFGGLFKDDLRIHLGVYLGSDLGVIWGCVLRLILDLVFGGVWSRTFGDNLGVYLRVYFGFIWGSLEDLEESSGISLGWLAREGDWTHSGQGSSCENHWGANCAVRIPSTICGRNPYSNIVFPT